MARKRVQQLRASKNVPQMEKMSKALRKDGSNDYHNPNVQSKRKELGDFKYDVTNEDS